MRIMKVSAIEGLHDARLTPNPTPGRVEDDKTSLQAAASIGEPEITESDREVQPDIDSRESVIENEDKDGEIPL